ncbi:hypothetical protein F4803DRAFT_205926 [Xylaria telfairii]|nr:hypothetical protein F4803DRAFT_205926 [Xylaria telfairii]
MNTLSKFCQLCKALKFDDSAFGGYAAQDEDGHKILKFDEDDRRRQFEVDLGLADAYPDFPLLSKSSVDNGCDGCRFLADAARKAIAQVDFDGFKEANYNIRVIHCWGRFDFDRPQDSRGLGALVLSVELLNDRGMSSSLACGRDES